MYKLKIGSHVKLNAPKYMINSVNEAVSYGSNAFMMYTGAPQNTRRTATEKLNIEQANELMKENGIEEVIIHAPYIINLANTIDESKFEFGVNFLTQELQRVSQIGSKVVVLHPGSHVKAGEDKGLDQIVRGLDQVFENTKDLDVKIALETMAGKGSELCYNFDHIKYIISNSKYPNRLGVCWDTCHMFDSGMDIINDFENVITSFEQIVGLDRLLVIHLNDSKNVLGSKKDRHENFGFGNIGFEALINVAYHPKLENITKILETPYINKTYPPYKEEIEMIKNKEFNEYLWDSQNEEK